MSTTRTDEIRLQIRPQIDTLPAKAPLEKFQNDTLRPVAKLQHDHLVALTTHYLAKRKVNLEQTAKEQRRDKLKTLLTRDNRFRSLVFGLVIGQFTRQEMVFYLEQEGNVNRRITNLLLERLLSVFG